MRPRHLAGPRAWRRLDTAVAFLLASTWLALHVFVVEYGPVLVLVVAVAVAVAGTLLRHPAG